MFEFCHSSLLAHLLLRQGYNLEGTELKCDIYANSYLYFKSSEQYLKKRQPSHPEGPHRQHQFSLADQARR